MRESISLLSGPDPSSAISRSFEWAAATAGDNPNSVLCLTQNDERASELSHRWEHEFDPLRLNTVPLDKFVGQLFEQATGTLSNSTLTKTERYRLVEAAIEQYSFDYGPFTRLQHPSNDLIDQVQGLFSLLEYAGYATPEAIEAALRSAGHSGDDGMAPELFGSFRSDTPPSDGGPLETQARVFSELYAEYSRLRGDIYPDWKTVRPEQYLHLLDEELLIETFPDTFEAVILDGLTRLSPAERESIARIARNVPTTAVIPLTHDSVSGIGIDVGIEEALEVYWAIGFELEYEIPDSVNEQRLAAIRQLRIESADELSYHLDEVDVEWMSPSTEREEVRTVARKVRTILDTEEVNPADIGIIVTDRTTYRGVLDEVLSTYDVPFTFTNDIGIEQTLVGDAILSLLDLADQDSVLDPIRALCANRLVNQGAYDVERSAISEAADNVSGESVSELVEELEERDHPDVADGVVRLVEAVDPTDTPLDEYVEAIESILGNLSIEDAVDRYSNTGEATGSHRPRYEAAAFNSVTSVLASLETAAQHLSDTNPAQRVRRGVRAELVRGPPQQRGYVRVLPLAESEMASFEHLFVLGLTSGYFPREQDTMAFFGEVNEADEEFTRAHTGRRAQYILGTLLTGSGNVVLSTPRHTVDGTEHVPAPFVSELKQFLEIEASSENERASEPPLVAPEDTQRVFASWAVRERFDSLDRPIDAISTADTLSAASREIATRGGTTAWRRSRPTLTVHDAQLGIGDDSPLEGREAYSPSALEDYARCPFVFLMRRVLGFEDEYGEEADISRADRGTYVHEVLAAFYRDFKEGPHEPVRLESVGRDVLEETMMTEALDHLEVLGDIETPFARRTVSRLLAGLGTRETNPFYDSGSPNEQDGLLARFLEHEVEESGNILSSPTYFEVAVDVEAEGVEQLQDSPIRIETPIGDVALRGIADRVDVVFGETRGFHVRDYKTGSTPLRKDVTHGTKLQLPLYGLVLERVLRDVTGEPHEMLGGSYYGLKAPNDIDPIASQVASREAVGASDGDRLLPGPAQDWHLPFDTRDEFSRFIREVTPDRLGRIATAIEHGAHQPTLLSASQANCEDCTFRNTCDVRHHHRRDTIDNLDPDRHYISERAMDTEFDLATYTDGGDP